ncbi:uncharacterized protein IL334_001138 [Kwoniella shivajii]|uniref:Uncharacterized protein n=1 Tax=Kwoniella shivajii TaxID=564305 RepID=A0ABZ1CR38_9TREE|nr:hypothetical protein IL334_001138 [Kwoniella shivajii]
MAHSSTPLSSTSSTSTTILSPPTSIPSSPDFDDSDIQELFLVGGPSRPLSRSRKKRGGQGIGGSVVGSMKRGLNPRRDSDQAREDRLNVLLTIAAILFLVLTTIWIVKLGNRMNNYFSWIEYLPFSWKAHRENKEL